ncbi:MAG TPA: methylmalonyl-CoA mutase family protein, partial [Flavobacteriales bacterium]|nr:methylmalonyl-CoA mutase family protein [Flavobacteriales bacterium]
MADETLFEAFPPATRAQWEAVIKKELKDKELSTLHVLVNGTALPPFHMAGESGPIGTRRRGVERDGNAWRGTFEVEASAANANDRVLEALMNGMDSVRVTGDLARLPEVLKDVLFGAIDLQLNGGDVATLRWLEHEAERQGIMPAELSVCMGMPHDAAVADLQEPLQAFPLVRLFEVDDPADKEAIRIGRDLLVRLLAMGFSTDNACARIQFRLHLGDDLFVEAARLRAFREAWAAVVDEFKPTHDCSHTTWIQVVVSFPTGTSSAHENLIRATLQAISAIAGG